jgi:uncharacterized protein (UPF0548 family)
MISAIAKMEHATRGQIGQPAACMMENKGALRSGEMHRDYGLRWRRFGNGDGSDLETPFLVFFTHKICG